MMRILVSQKVVLVPAFKASGSQGHACRNIGKKVWDFWGFGGKYQPIAINAQTERSHKAADSEKLGVEIGDLWRDLVARLTNNTCN
ncbi:hypothetical protein QT974_11345 [Microcoleus sp. herbarium12]